MTRKMVDMVLTTLITGSPFGLGVDPELNVSSVVAQGILVLCTCIPRFIRRKAGFGF